MFAVTVSLPDWFEEEGGGGGCGGGGGGGPEKDGSAPGNTPEGWVVGPPLGPPGEGPPPGGPPPGGPPPGKG